MLGFHLLLLGMWLAAGHPQSQEAAPEFPTADAIMARVAENQDRAQKLRSEYVYRQRVTIKLRKKHGKLMREETADYEVVPSPTGNQKVLKRLEGRYWHKGKYMAFHGEPVPGADSLDGDLISDFRSDLTNDKSKDGLARDLFPLTTEEQKKYQFTLLGEKTHQGRQAYRIGFRPRDRREFTWTGEALVDAADYEPVQVFTRLSRRVPFAVRTLLGTDVPGVGFNVEYRRQDGGVWFPTSFGTEFRLHAVFFINREISISMENTDFARTRVKSRITGVEPEK
jgi:hypothetical protein